MSTLDVVHGVQEIDEAYPRYKIAEDMYSGTAKEYFPNTAVGRALSKTGDIGRFNFIKRIVNTVANRVQLSSISIPGEQNSAENLKLDQIREANEMELYEKLIIRKTLMYGDSYVIVWRVSEEDESEDQLMIDAGVSLTYNSPLGMRMIYDPNNERKPLYAIKCWSEDKRRRADVYYRDRVERYITTQDNVKGYEVNQWIPFTEDLYDEESGEFNSDNGIVAHDFGEIPVIHFRTDLTYGVSEAIDGYNPQRAINKALVTLIASLEKTGYPLRVYLMDPAKLDDNNAEDEANWDDDEVPSSAPSVSSAPLRDEPGTIQKAFGVRDAKEFTAANPNNFLDPIMSFIKLMAMVTETPAYELNPEGNQPSGEARRQADKPLEAKVKDRQVFLRGSFANLYRLALKASDVVTTVDVQWAPTSPINDSEGWNTIAAKQAAGVPVAQTLEEAGYSEEQITQWLDNIAEATTLEQKVETLGKIAVAMKDLGTAVTLQVISPEQVEQIVSSLIDSLNGESEEE